MSMKSYSPWRPLHVAIVLAVPVIAPIITTQNAIGQGFNLAPPNTQGRTNIGGFVPRSGSSPNTGGFNNQPGFNNNSGAQVAAGVLGLIGAGINAANQANRNQQFSFGRQSPAPSIDPNSSGRNNYNGFNSNQWFQSTPSNTNRYSNSSNTNRYYYPSNSGYSTRSSQSSSNRYNGNTYPSGTRTIRYSDGRSETIYSGAPVASSSSGSRIISASATTPAYTPNQPPSISKLNETLPIVLRCPAEEIGIFSYQLINRSSGKTYDFTMTPGQKQEFKGGSKWKIRFDQGKGKGTLAYDLGGGTTYQIRKNGDELWGVYAE